GVAQIQRQAFRELTLERGQRVLNDVAPTDVLQFFQSMAWGEYHHERPAKQSGGGDVGVRVTLWSDTEIHFPGGHARHHALHRGIDHLDAYSGAVPRIGCDNLGQQCGRHELGGRNAHDAGLEFLALRNFVHYPIEVIQDLLDERIELPPDVREPSTPCAAI